MTKKTATLPTSAEEGQRQSETRRRARDGHTSGWQKRQVNEVRDKWYQQTN